MPRPSFVLVLRAAFVHHLPLGTLLRGVFAVVALLGGSACSFIYNLDSNQCTVDTDCREVLGSKFAKYVCERGVCVAPQVKPAPSEDTQAPPDAGPVGCTSHAECIAEHLDRPFICRAGECIDLYSDECPVVLQAKNLEVPEPIIIGAYSSIDP